VEFDLSSDHVTQISVYTHTSNENNNISTSLRFDTARSSENSKATSCSWADQVKTLTKYTGRQESFPAWPLDGFIAGVTGGSDKVRDVVKTLKDADIPLTSVWIQDWAGRSADGRYVSTLSLSLYLTSHTYTYSVLCLIGKLIYAIIQIGGILFTN